MERIFINGNIYTVDSDNPFAQAVAVQDGRFCAVGDNDQVKALAGSNTEVVDLAGRFVVPGFNDSHLHIVSHGYALTCVDLNGCRSIDEVIKRCRDFIADKRLAAGEWLIGRGWNQENFTDGKNRFPTRDDLDKISTAHPVRLIRACGHASVANSKALAAAGIGDKPQQPDGGHIDIDGGGRPNGILRENAAKLLEPVMSQLTADTTGRYLEIAGADALANGITSVQSDDLLFGGIAGGQQQVSDELRRLSGGGGMPLRIYEQCRFYDLDNMEQFVNSGNRTGSGNNFYKVGPIKLMGDGSLGSRTAYMVEPYADDPSTRGIAVLDKRQIHDMITAAHNLGMQVAIHCIGDQTMYDSFAAFAAAQQQSPRADARHGIVHAQITDPQLLKKFRDQKIIAYIQPVFLDADSKIVESRIGKERAKSTYVWKTMHDMGIAIPLGTDCPVEPLKTMPNLYSVVTRRRLDGSPQDGWLPEERLSVTDAIYWYTQGAAYSSFEENIKGSISVGKLADMAVLSEDLLKIEPEKLLCVETTMTVLDGKVVYKK